jgi:hypothetical protein
VSGAQRFQEALEERGFDDVEGVICLSHIINDSLRNAVDLTATEGTCRLCSTAETGGPTTPVVTLHNVMVQVMDAVHFLYDSPENAGVPWDGGWQGADVFESWDVIEDVCSGAFDDSSYDSLVEIFIGSMLGTEWTANRHGSSLDAARWGWEQFVSDVTSESRFVFLADADVEGFGSPGQRSARFLQTLLPYVEDDRLGLLSVVPVSASFFRGRLVKNNLDRMHTAKDLGPAPAKLAAANRMSPEGIPMFYASASAETAVREIAAHGTGDYARIGAFHNERALAVLDLTGPLALPSIFDRNERERYGVLQFFRDFALHVAAPVTPDGRPHMQYIPTQIVTEFFRWVPKKAIDGIKLRSAQDGNDTYVLFFNDEQVGDATMQDKDDHSKRSIFDAFEPDPPVFTLKAEDVTTYKVIRRIDAEPVP